MDNVTPQSHGFHQMKTKPGVGLLHIIVGQEAPVTPPNTGNCLPARQDNKTLLLMMPMFFMSQDIEKLSQCWLAFTVPEGTVQAAGECCHQRS